jgi:integrase
MPAAQHGQIDGKPGAYRLRWYDRDGKRRTKQPFKSKTDARNYYRDVVEPALLGRVVQPQDCTLSEFVAVYLERHAPNVRPRTVKILRDRLGYATRRFGSVPLREFERMAGEVASWRATLPEGSRYGVTAALRQCLRAALQWGYITQNPAVLAGKNPPPPPRSVRAFSFEEIERIAAELSPMYQPLPMFAAATGLRPEEWQALERKDIDRQAGVLYVRRTVSSGEIVELGKTSRSRRQVPLSLRALAALDALPPRLDTPLLFPSPEGRLLHIDNFRHREWSPAIEAGEVRRPARIYDMRHTFASNAIAAGIGLFELARVMGTSPEMIERVYGTLLDGAGESIAGRLGAWEARQGQGREEAG